MEVLVYEVIVILGKTEACQIYSAGPTKTNAVLPVISSFWENWICSSSSTNNSPINVCEYKEWY